MLFSGALWLIFWGAMVWLLASAWRPASRRGEPGDPLEVARLRYARGELDRQTFDHLLRDLEQSGHARSVGSRHGPPPPVAQGPGRSGM